MKKHTLIVLLLICAVCFSAFANPVKETSANQELRIVTLAPNMTELVYALGCQDSLVGRSSSCMYPEECLSVPSVGDMWKPDIETIVSLNPSIVIASSLTDDASIDALKKAGVNAVKINYDQRLEGTYNLIEEVGQLIGKTEEARELADSAKTRIEKVRSKAESTVSNKKSVVYIISWGDWGDYAATGDTFIGDIIEAAGAENAAKKASYWAISKELLLSEDPDIIVIPSYSYQDADIEGFSHTSPYNQLHGQIVTVNGDSAERQGVRTADFVEELYSIVYPESN